MKVIVSDLARSQLREIAFFIARDNPERAKTFSKDLREKTVNIGSAPYAFPIVERFAHSEIRRRVHRTTLFSIKLRENVVRIVSVLHGARDYEPLLSIILSKD